MVKLEYIKHQLEDSRWVVSENWTGKAITGGAVIAFFYREDLAREYVEYKNKTDYRVRKGKELVIKTGKFDTNNYNGC